MARLSGRKKLYCRSSLDYMTKWGLISLLNYDTTGTGYDVGTVPQ